MADFNARLKPKRSTVSGEVPSGADLEVGEIAISTADAKLFTKHTDGTIKVISGTGGGGGGSINKVEDIENVEARQVVRSDILDWATTQNPPTANGGWFYDGSGRLDLYRSASDGTDVGAFIATMPTTGTLFFSEDNLTYVEVAYTSRVIDGDVCRFTLVLQDGTPTASQIWVTFTDPLSDSSSLEGDVLVYDASSNVWRPTQYRIQDAPDFGLNEEGAGTIQYDFAWTPKGPGGAPADGQWGTDQLRWSAIDKDGKPYSTSGVTKFWLSPDTETWYEETQTIQFFAPYYYVQTIDIPTLHQRILDEGWTSLYLSFVEPTTRPGGSEKALADGDLLAWSGLRQKFTPLAPDQIDHSIQTSTDFGLNPTADPGRYVNFSGSQITEEAIWTGAAGLVWTDGDFFISDGSNGNPPAFAWNVNDSNNDALQTLQVGDIVAFDFDTSDTYTVTEVGGDYLEERYFRIDATPLYAFGTASGGTGSLSNIKITSVRFPEVAEGDTVPLAAGDVLSWDATRQKFTPAQVATSLSGLSETEIGSLNPGQGLVVNQAGDKWVNGPQLTRWVVPGGDPFADQVTFLAEFDDSLEVNGEVPSGGGSVTLALGKFGNAATFPGNASLNYGLTSAVDMPADFTIDFWVNVDNHNRDHGFVAKRNQTGAATGSWGIVCNAPDGVWKFSDLQTISNFVGGALTPGQWHHCAVVRSGTTLSTYTDGVLNNSATCTTNFTTTESLRVGNWDVSNSRRMEGQIDDLRFTVGVARYTSDFNVPTGSASSGGGADAVPTVPLDILTDVDTSSVADGYVLQYTEALEQWEAKPNIAGDGIARVQDATDWKQTDILEGQSMVWDGTEWVPGFPMLSQGDLVSGQATTSLPAAPGDLIGPAGAYADTAAAEAAGWTIEGATGDDATGKLAVPAALQGLSFAGIPLLVNQINNGTNGNLCWDNSDNNGSNAGRDGNFITDSANHDFWLAHWSQDTAVQLCMTRFDGTDWVIRIEYKIPYQGVFACVVETTFSVDTTIKVVYSPNIGPDAITSTQGIASNGTAIVDGFGVAANSLGDYTFKFLPTQADGRKLSDLLDVNYPYGTDEDYVLMHDGSQFVASPLVLNFLFDVDNDMSPTEGQQLKYNATDFQWEAKDPLPRRVTGSGRTGVLPSNATEDVDIADIGSAGMFLKVTADEDCWIRFYTSSAARTADTRTSSDVSPSRGDGVLLELIATGDQPYTVTPTVHYFQESPANGTMYMRVTNLKAAETAFVDVQIEVLMLEE